MCKFSFFIFHVSVGTTVAHKKTQFLLHRLLQLHHLKTARGWSVHTREPGSQPFKDPQTYRPINQYQFGITHRLTDASPVHNAGATVSGHFIHQTHPSLSLRGTGLFLLPPLLMVIHPGFMFKIVPLQRSTVRYSA